MRSFPSQLNPKNLHRLPDFRKNRKLCYLRRHIYEAMLDPSFSIPNNCGINLQNVNMGGLSGSEYTIDQSLIDQISSELEERGFKTTSSYGGTMVFVHTPDLVPQQAVSCSGFE
jgi:hypothetical protein